ncbi:hypothetical protein [Bacillus sp. SG-1]|uniref:hypothetical protein n=1 Tax=Bacillus sp. SG-1 TaxID=161544 RepID=UPI0012EA5033|nr:hypothetical protein [Bacillus sp. SG-1]
MKNFYPYSMGRMNPMSPGEQEYMMNMTQGEMNPYQMEGMDGIGMTGNMYGANVLNPLQMSGIDDDYLVPMTNSGQYDMQQGQNPYDIYGMQEGDYTSPMQGMQPGTNPYQMPGMPSMNPYPAGMNTGQMNGLGTDYTYTPTTGYGPQYGYSPQEGFKPQFMQGAGNTGYGPGLPYGPYQVGPTEGYFAPGPPYLGGPPLPGSGMPGHFGMTPGQRRRFFW